MRFQICIHNKAKNQTEDIAQFIYENQAIDFVTSNWEHYLHNLNWNGIYIFDNVNKTITFSITRS